jgi:hypothetical protein
MRALFAVCLTVLLAGDCFGQQGGKPTEKELTPEAFEVQRQQHDFASFVCIVTGLVLIFPIAFAVSYSLHLAVSCLRRKAVEYDFGLFELLIGGIPGVILLFFLWHDIPNAISPDPRPQWDAQQHQKGLVKQKEAVAKQDEAIKEHEAQTEKSNREAEEKARNSQVIPFPK